MKRIWENKVKKLALACETGWEYIPESEEAGSVLMDLFLDMEEENQNRYRQVWDKQELVFLQAAPESDRGTGKLKGALSVRASSGNDGGLLEQGTGVHTVTEQGELVCFRTTHELRLTAAELKYAIYRKGLCAWLAYDRKRTEDNMSIALFQPAGEQLMRTSFCWCFAGLWDGHQNFSFIVDFLSSSEVNTPLSGLWFVSDGRVSYPMAWQRREGNYILSGECPEFAGNLENAQYEVRLELSAKELTQEWADRLWSGVSLTEETAEGAPEKCIVDSGGCGADRVLPFGNTLYESACCYLSCDRAVICASGEVTMRFTECFEIQEKLPEKLSEEYEKLYKKYPWMRPQERVRDWAAEYTVWEYFNGRRWCVLPEGAEWRTGCPSEAKPDMAERVFRWRRPADMCPCAVDGEEHFYLRLRLCSVANAFAVYYHKYVPVLEHIRFSWEARKSFSIRQDIPKRCNLQEETMYLGFSGMISPENRWYTGDKSIAFAAGEIAGEGERFGRDACWVELKHRDAESWACLLPNYVEIMQESGESPSIPAGSFYAVESKNYGVLDAVSVSDARCVGGETPLCDERIAAEHYFAHYGKLVTISDMELLMQERYPYLHVENCVFQGESGELEVTITTTRDFYRMAEEKLPEIREWLESAVSRMGAIWLRHSSVKCGLEIAGKGAERKGRNNAETKVAG